MAKRIVIALGGNALGKNLHEQMDAVNITAKAIADLIEEGYELVTVNELLQLGEIEIGPEPYVHQKGE